MASPVVTGRVAGKGLSDELKGTFYAVVSISRRLILPGLAREPERARPPRRR